MSYLQSQVPWLLQSYHIVICNLTNKMQTNNPVNVMWRMWLTSCKSRTIERPQTKHTASHTDWLHLRDAWCSYHAGVTNMFMQWRKWSKTDSLITLTLFIHCFTMECPGICLRQIQTQIIFDWYQKWSKSLWVVGWVGVGEWVVVVQFFCLFNFNISSFLAVICEPERN